ncbi:uroporphyrinogen-III C-methyltransferase [Bacteroides propionicifaciens]|uniref:uroporphyrinogen-III C-methyltransferase n=1 Tax=Bacteroides propionicifaciens TaxID=392838 RepID=UPI00035EF33B|nr:uroporphyrinogen-III C-methyltransferase [Bacteroides propionicifaciens]
MKTNNIIKVVSRSSKLAIKQVDETFKLLPEIKYSLLTLESFGDHHKHLSLLSDTIRPDFFTKELDEMLLTGKADIAIHSAKDLPYPLPQGLEIIALTSRADNSDSLVCRKELKGCTLENLPQETIIGTSSAKRKQEIETRNEHLILKSIRGTIEERIAQVDNGAYDGVIIATCALDRLGLEDRITQRLDFQTHPLQGALAIVSKQGRDDLKQLFKPLDARSCFGKVYLVGAGPGSPDLITLRGKTRLEQADIIYYDDLIDKNILSTLQDKELVYVGKRKNVHSKEQGDINTLLVNSAMEGKQVVRFKGGDPMIFAHGGEEIEYLQSNLVEVEVVPGISTANALSALCKIPLTHRDLASSLAFVSGHALYGLQIPKVDTLVYYMAGTKIKQIATQMITESWDPQTPVALIHNVSLPDQKEFYYTLTELAEQEIEFPRPVIIVIGKVVDLKFKSAKSLNPQKNVLVTGLDPTPYHYLGQTIHTPLIEMKALSDLTELNATLNRLDRYESLLFTSKNTVEHFFEALHKQNKDSRTLAHLKVFSIGRTTSKELLKYGIRADYQAVQEDSIGVIELFRANNIGGKLLVPRSNLALDLIPNGLRAIGIEVDTVITYQNVLPKSIKKVELNTIETVVFTSPSCVTNFLEVYETIPTNKTIIVRGKTTYEYLKKLEYPMQQVELYKKP